MMSKSTKAALVWMISQGAFRADQVKPRRCARLDGLLFWEVACDLSRGREMGVE